MKKYIVVTGGVLSGIGKGVSAAAIGKLLCSEYKIIPIKCDGYLNTDPGTMNPTEHGEVFVLEDGREVDMDFGHYERFLGINCKANWNLTMGRVYEEIRKNERRGKYLGKTVQLIPHVTNHIKEIIYSISKKEKSDITIIEIGGTVGDMENMLFLTAVQQMKREVGKENMIYAHVTYVPTPFGVNEQKSKPTQQSVEKLLSMGINPDIIIARCKKYLTNGVKKKISSFCNVEEDSILTGVDTKNIYEIPLIFERQGLTKVLSDKLRIPIEPSLDELKRLIYNMENTEKEVNIVICGKYSSLEDSYASIIEALKHCSANLKIKINNEIIETTDLENKDLESILKGKDGIIVPGGFGGRGIEGKISVIKYARENNIPFLGLCLGLQAAVIEYIRNVCKIEDANSTEFDENTKNPVIVLMDKQKKIIKKGGTMRLGSCTAYLEERSRIRKRHRHRYEVNPCYHELLTKDGMALSGTSKDGKLVEFIELPKHKFFVATQSHPEFKSRLEEPAPLFYHFIKACLK